MAKGDALFELLKTPWKPLTPEQAEEFAADVLPLNQQILEARLELHEASLKKSECLKKVKRLEEKKQKIENEYTPGYRPLLEQGAEAAAEPKKRGRKPKAAAAPAPPSAELCPWEIWVWREDERKQTIDGPRIGATIEAPCTRAAAADRARTEFRDAHGYALRPVGGSKPTLADMIPLAGHDEELFETEETEADGAPIEEPKRGRGRPKGAKNKAKGENEAAAEALTPVSLADANGEGPWVKRCKGCDAEYEKDRPECPECGGEEYRICRLRFEVFDKHRHVKLGTIFATGADDAKARAAECWPKAKEIEVSVFPEETVTEPITPRPRGRKARADHAAASA